MLRKREADTTVVVVADGPAVRRRHARHAIEEVMLGGAGAGRVDDGPGGPVPALDESLIKAAGVDREADGPADGRRGARQRGGDVPGGSAGGGGVGGRA